MSTTIIPQSYPLYVAVDWGDGGRPTVALVVGWRDDDAALVPILQPYGSLERTFGACNGPVNGELAGYTTDPDQVFDFVDHIREMKVMAEYEREKHTAA